LIDLAEYQIAKRFCVHVRSVLKAYRPGSAAGRAADRPLQPVVGLP